jgi:UDP-N-acetylglucosamine 3-dehydrogenase
MQKDSPMRTIRAGVIGVGHLGYHHARHYAALEGCTLVGVVDAHSDHLNKAMEDFSVPGYSSVDALIDAGVEAVSVATPTTTHSEITLKLLQAGVHVLVEKPIAPTLHEAETMVAVAKAHNCLLAGRPYRAL